MVFRRSVILLPLIMNLVIGVTMDQTMNPVKNSILNMFLFNPFLASGDVCRLLITFVNNLDLDQDQRSKNCLLL